VFGSLTPEMVFKKFLIIFGIWAFLLSHIPHHHCCLYNAASTDLSFWASTACWVEVVRTVAWIQDKACSSLPAKS
jgi:hypothetical protein